AYIWSRGYRSDRGEQGLELLDDVAVEADGGDRVIGRRPLRDDRDPSPCASRHLGETANGIDLERRADAEQKLRAGRESDRLLHRALREELAEQDDVRLDWPATSAAARHSFCVEEAVDGLEGVRRPAVQAGAGLDRAVHLDH